MMLMTKELETRFQAIGSQETNPDPIVIAKYFNPYGGGDWFATEYDPTDKIFFGYVSLFNDWNNEWGNFALSELEENKIERDLYIKELPISESKALKNIV